jgi:hypothetical protein
MKPAFGTRILSSLLALTLLSSSMAQNTSATKVPPPSQQTKNLSIVGFLKTSSTTLGPILEPSKSLLYIGSDMNVDVAKLLVQQQQKGKNIVVICGSSCKAPIFKQLQQLKMQLRVAPEALEQAFLVTDKYLITGDGLMLSNPSSPIYFTDKEPFVGQFKQAIPVWMEHSRAF